MRRFFLFSAWGTIIALLAWICKDELAEIMAEMMNVGEQPEAPTPVCSCGYAAAN